MPILLHTWGSIRAICEIHWNHFQTLFGYSEGQIGFVNKQYHIISYNRYLTLVLRRIVLINTNLDQPT